MLSYKAQVLRDIVYRNAFEVKNLTTRQYGWDDLMFLRSGQNKDGMRRRFLKCFQERIEGLLREHVHLINNVHLEFPGLRRKTYLVNQATDVIYRVVRSGIQFKDVQRQFLFAQLGTRIDYFGENARTRGLTYTARTTEQQGLRQMVVVHTFK
ncbi:MAG: Uncharacterised protein [Cryomorphaceae bacterium]|nr:MAG: Uncharacterised protein [Cryomorphaceae bacterium]